jgi:hypothetical protein
MESVGLKTTGFVYNTRGTRQGPRVEQTNSGNEAVRQGQHSAMITAKTGKVTTRRVLNDVTTEKVTPEVNRITAQVPLIIPSGYLGTPLTPLSTQGNVSLISIKTQNHKLNNINQSILNESQKLSNEEMQLRVDIADSEAKGDYAVAEIGRQDLKYIVQQKSDLSGRMDVHSCKIKAGDFDTEEDKERRRLRPNKARQQAEGYKPEQLRSQARNGKKGEYDRSVAGSNKGGGGARSRNEKEAPSVCMFKHFKITMSAYLIEDVKLGRIYDEIVKYNDDVKIENDIIYADSSCVTWGFKNISWYYPFKPLETEIVGVGKNGVEVVAVSQKWLDHCLNYNFRIASQKTQNIQRDTTMDLKLQPRYVRKTLIYLPSPENFLTIESKLNCMLTASSKNMGIVTSCKDNLVHLILETIVLTIIRISLGSTNMGTYIEYAKVYFKIKLIESLLVLEFVSARDMTFMNAFIHAVAYTEAASNNYLRYLENETDSDWTFHKSFEFTMMSAHNILLTTVKTLMYLGILPDEYMGKPLSNDVIARWFDLYYNEKISYTCNDDYQRKKMNVGYQITGITLLIQSVDGGCVNNRLSTFKLFLEDRGWMGLVRKLGRTEYPKGTHNRKCTRNVGVSSLLNLFYADGEISGNFSTIFKYKPGQIHRAAYKWTDDDFAIISEEYIDNLRMIKDKWVLRSMFSCILSFMDGARDALAHLRILEEIRKREQEVAEKKEMEDLLNREREMSNAKLSDLKDKGWGEI